MAELDSPWKEALDEFLQLFLLMFFPALEKRIDWSLPPESLDNELAKLFPEGAVGKRFVDRLYKVRLLDGEDFWVLIHIEVQSQRDDEFPKRVFRYFCRLEDKFDLNVTCLIVLADESRTWRPNEYLHEFAGTRVQFTFPTVKLADYRDRIDELECSDNLFALIVLAHLQSQRIKALESRLDWKLRITKNLLERDIDETRRWKVLILLDWLLDLPLELNEIYWSEVTEWKERNVMPFVSSLEQILEARIGSARKKEGRQEGELIGLWKGLETALEIKFDEAGKAFAEELKAVVDVSKLEDIRQAVRGAGSIDDLRKLL